jgi:MAEBL
MPTETTVLHSSEETNPILDRAKEKLKEELKEAEKALVDANTKLGALGESASEEDKAKAIDELTKAKAKVDDLKEKLKAAEGTHEDGEVTPSPVVPGAGAVESPTTGGTETQPQPKEDEGHKPAPSTGGTETKPVSPTPGSEEGHGTTETHEGTPAGGETHTETPGPADHLEDHAAHAEEGKHEETHEEKKPSADEAALKAKAEEAKAKVETAKTDLEKAQAKVEELAKDEHASEEDKAKAAKALVEAKAKVEETTKEAAKAEAAANPANKLGGVAFALASGAYRML